MTETPRFLAPDDEPEAPAAPLAEEDTLEDEPYGLAAVMVGLVALLLLCAVLPHVRVWQELSEHVQGAILLLTVMLAAIAGYLALILARARLPLTPLCILAAVLGLLVSQPAYTLYAAPWLHVNAATTLFAEVVAAGISGFIVAAFLAPARRPRLTILISFLLLFVVVNGAHILVGLLPPR